MSPLGKPVLIGSSTLAVAGGPLSMEAAHVRRLRNIAALLLFALSTAGCSALGVDRLEPLAPFLWARPDRLTLVSWNAQKGQDPRFRSDLRALLETERPDLLFLQEARRDLISPRTVLGLFARSWRYPWPGGTTIGVLTLSSLPTHRAEPLQTRHREFLVTAPKTSLLSEHSLPGGARLLAANVHLLNFERFSTRQLEAQIADLQGRLGQHEGPVLLAGDFNVWSPDRLARVEALAAELDLLEVLDFPKGRRTGDLGTPWNRVMGVDPDLPLDRVYYRGLEPVEAVILPYASSDHPPIRVSFAIETEAEAAPFTSN